MNRKDNYETPEMEIITFETEDVITTSGNETPIVPPGNHLLDDDYMIHY